MPAPMFSSVAPIPRSTAPNGASAVGLAMVPADFTECLVNLVLGSTGVGRRGRGRRKRRETGEEKSGTAALGRAAAVLPAARSCAGLRCLPGAWGAAGEAVPLRVGRGRGEAEGRTWRHSARPLSTPSRFGTRPPCVPVHAGAAVRTFLTAAQARGALWLWGVRQTRHQSVGTYVCAWVATAPRAGESCARSCAWVLLAREQCLVAKWSARR